MVRKSITTKDIIRCCNETGVLAQYQFATKETFDKIEEVFKRYCNQYGHYNAVSRFTPPDAIDGIRIRCVDGIVDLIWSYNSYFDINVSSYFSPTSTQHLLGNDNEEAMIDI